MRPGSVDHVAVADLHAGSGPEHDAPLLDRRQAEHVVALPGLAHRRGRLGGVLVAGVEHRVVGDGGEPLREAVVHLVGVAAGEVGAAAAVEEQRVARDEAAVDEEALAARACGPGVCTSVIGDRRRRSRRRRRRAARGRTPTRR